MAEFLKDSKLFDAIEQLICNAKEQVVLISPFIKLHDRIKECLKSKKDKHDLEIIVVFGKNEEDVSKSLNRSDFEFFKGFPNIMIGYERRLHAKYYASEDFSIITSMNLHEFSHNNNKEVGIKLKTKGWLNISSETVDRDAGEYFFQIINECEVLYQNEPQYKSTLLGLRSKYLGSMVAIDEYEDLLTKKNGYQSNNRYKVKKSIENNLNGFCIRTGKSIPFNPAKPMSKDAYDSWNQFKNKNYPEKFCHKTGVASSGKTTMQNPILQ